ncbi:hypothetical protein ACJW31_07G084800 [Castanea mollissima]
MLEEMNRVGILGIFFVWPVISYSVGFVSFLFSLSLSLSLHKTNTICACVIINMDFVQNIIQFYSMNRRIRKCLKASHLTYMKPFFRVTGGQSRERQSQSEGGCFFLLIIIRYIIVGSGRKI